MSRAQVGPRRTRSCPLLTRFGVGMVLPPSEFFEHHPGQFRVTSADFPARARRHWVSADAQKKFGRSRRKPLFCMSEEGGGAP
ncbi:hypothetical protein [Nitrosomonas communis]|uniref:hypothetical protein n=1 Tax=Nitrosomonas communis TaxID=44574 RepID=UPI001160418D|nr:hypothetical protein [Nitrosomonas communis]